MSASNRAMVQYLFTHGLNRHDLSVMMELLSDCTFHLPLVGEVRGEAMMQFFTSLLTAFPDIQRTIKEMVTDDIHNVAALWSLTGTHLGPFMGIAPTGKRIAITGVSMYRISGGKIVEEWVEWDALGLMQQLGAVPTFQHEAVTA